MPSKKRTLKNPLPEPVLTATPPLTNIDLTAADLMAADLTNEGLPKNLWAGPLTDLGNARRLVRAFGSDMRYLPAAKAWLIWDGRRWAKDDTGQVSRFARQVTDFLMDQARDGTTQAGDGAAQAGDGAKQAMQAEGQTTTIVPVMPGPPNKMPGSLNEIPNSVNPGVMEFEAGVMEFEAVAKAQRQQVKAQPAQLEVQQVQTEVQQVQLEVQQVLADARRKASGTRLAFARRSQALSRLEAMVTLAQAEPGMAVRPADLDKDPFLLCTHSGTVDLKTGTLRPHRRGDLITKLAPAVFDLAAPCPLWERTLARILPDPAVQAFVQRSAGYALTGSTREQCVFFWHGSGRNGKTTVIEALRSVLGDYALETPADTLIAKSGGGGIPSDLARLAGARFVTARETEDGQKLAESLIKHVSGGDALTARFLFGEWFEFLPVLKLFLSTNHRPQVRGTDEGIWRRLRLVPFAETLSPAEVDTALPEKLRAEAAGILAWAMRGCLAWQQEGLCPPPAVLAATEDYRVEMDAAGQFFSERCVFGPGLSQSAGALYQAFAAWAAGSGLARVSPQAFAQRLLARGLSKRRGGTGFVWDGVQLLPEEPAHL